MSIIGVLSNFVGTALPRKWFNPERFPYKSLKIEKVGRIYEKLHIRKWKDKVPDMSKIYKRMVPKKFDIASNSESLMILIRETCVAEFIHDVLIILGLGCMAIWDEAGGVICSLLWFLGNIPFVIIQRYNRPKLLKTYLRLSEYEKNGKKVLHSSCNQY